MTIDKLFAEQGNGTENAGDTSMSATVTEDALKIAASIIKKVSKQPEQFQEAILASMKSNDAMDTLIYNVHPMTEEQAQFLNALSEDELDRMLKSQQSKRSRLKKMVMTQENYQKLMSAGVAEIIIRLAMGKKKTPVTRGGDNFISEKEADELAADQVVLRKAIRNVQSKKSIMRTRSDFDPESEAWQTLLDAEYKLKARRIGGYTTGTQCDEKVKNIIGQRDVNTLSADEMRDILSKLNSDL